MTASGFTTERCFQKTFTKSKPLVAFDEMFGHGSIRVEDPKVKAKYEEIFGKGLKKPKSYDTYCKPQHMNKNALLDIKSSILKGMAQDRAARSERVYPITDYKPFVELLEKSQPAEDTLRICAELKEPKVVEPEVITKMNVAMSGDDVASVCNRAQLRPVVEVVGDTAIVETQDTFRVAKVADMEELASTLIDAVEEQGLNVTPIKEDAEERTLANLISTRYFLRNSAKGEWCFEKLNKPLSIKVLDKVGSILGDVTCIVDRVVKPYTNEFIMDLEKFIQTRSNILYWIRRCNIMSDEIRLYMQRIRDEMKKMISGIGDVRSSDDVSIQEVSGLASQLEDAPLECSGYIPYIPKLLNGFRAGRDTIGVAASLSTLLRECEGLESHHIDRIQIMGEDGEYLKECIECAIKDKNIRCASEDTRVVIGDFMADTGGGDAFIGVYSDGRLFEKLRDDANYFKELKLKLEKDYNTFRIVIGIRDIHQLLSIGVEFATSTDLGLKLTHVMNGYTGCCGMVFTGDCVDEPLSSQMLEFAHRVRSQILKMNTAYVMGYDLDLGYTYYDYLGLFYFTHYDSRIYRSTNSLDKVKLVSYMLTRRLKVISRKEYENG